MDKNYIIVGERNGKHVVRLKRDDDKAEKVQANYRIIEVKGYYLVRDSGRD